MGLCSFRASTEGCLMMIKFVLAIGGSKALEFLFSLLLLDQTNLSWNWSESRCWWRLLCKNMRSFSVLIDWTLFFGDSWTSKIVFMEVSSGHRGASIKWDFYWGILCNSISRTKNDKKGDQGVFSDPSHHADSLEFSLKKIFPPNFFNDFQIARLIIKMCLWELF